jgi:hypothetical protein
LRHHSTRRQRRRSRCSLRAAAQACRTVRAEPVHPRSRRRAPRSRQQRGPGVRRDIDITGGIIDGGGTGAPAGSFGWGIRGQGLGCGTPDGKNCEGQRVGPYATIGWEGRDYAGPFSQRPGQPGRPGDRVAKAPPVKLGPPVACTQDAPCLDKEIIRRYVKRNIQKITYCYETQLLANPGLEGTVMVNFTLNGNGRVIDSNASGVDPAVSSCIASVVSNIRFPKVGDDGIYPIKYPFQLRPTGR